MLQPSEQEFERLAARGFNLIPVFEEVAADLETPVSAFLKIARGDYSFLLESVRGGEKWGRYTFLGSEPSVVMRARKNRMDIIRPGTRDRSPLASQLRSKNCAPRSSDFALPRLPTCRDFSAARWDFSPTISCDVSSRFPRPRTTISARPTST